MAYLDRIKKFVKKSRFGSYLVSLIPKSLLYTRSYLDVFKLHRLQQDKRHNEVDIILRERMVDILQNALRYVAWYKRNVPIDYRDINRDNVYDILNQFPYTDKKLIMDNWSDFINEKYNHQFLKIGSTEGTTGEGMKIANTVREIGIQTAFFECNVDSIRLDFIRTRIVRIGLEALKSIEESPFTRSGNRLLVSPVHLVDKWLPKIYAKIVEFKPIVIHSYPTLLFLLSQYIVGNNLPPINVKLLLLASDVFLYSHSESFIKAFGNPEIKCSYNMSEHVALGYAIVNNRDHKISYKLDELYAYTENKKDEYGRYEIIGTSYWNMAMPFIKYGTKDYGRIENSIITQLDGRETTYLTTKSGDKIAGISMLEPDDYYWEYMSAYQFVQKKQGVLTMRIVPKNKYTASVERRIIKDMSNRWPGLFDISIELVNEIQRGNSTKVQSIIIEG